MSWMDTDKKSGLVTEEGLLRLRFLSPKFFPCDLMYVSDDDVYKPSICPVPSYLGELQAVSV